jgi:hypothetical protein
MILFDDIYEMAQYVADDYDIDENELLSNLIDFFRNEQAIEFIELSKGGNENYYLFDTIDKYNDQVSFFVRTAYLVLNSDMRNYKLKIFYAIS